MKNKNRFFLAFTILGVATLFGTTSCYKDKTIQKVEVTTNPCDSLNTDFTTVTQPLIESNCSTGGCHETGAGGYHLITYAEISGNATQISHVINYDAGYSPMPQGAPKLADSLIQKFDCWVSKGMPQ